MYDLVQFVNRFQRKIVHGNFLEERDGRTIGQAMGAGMFPVNFRSIDKRNILRKVTVTLTFHICDQDFDVGIYTISAIR